MTNAYAPIGIVKSEHRESEIIAARIHLNIQFRKHQRIGTVCTKMLSRKTYIIFTLDATLKT